MSKRIYQVTHCEFCEKQIEVEKTKDAYDSCRIEVGGMTVLLSPSLAKRHKKYNNQFPVKGIFCTPQCLKDYIDKTILRSDDRGAMLADELGMDEVAPTDEDGNVFYNDEYDDEYGEPSLEDLISDPDDLPF